MIHITGKSQIAISKESDYTKIKRLAIYLKNIISLLIAGYVLLLWLTQALLALDAGRRGGDFGTYFSEFILIKLSLVALILSIIIFILNLLAPKKIVFTKSAYYSGIILLLSLSWGSWSIYWNIQDSNIKFSGAFDEIPGVIIIKLFDKIPGFFPLSQNLVLYLIQNFFLTFSTVVLIYIVLISVKIALVRLFAYIDKKLPGETFTHE